MEPFIDPNPTCPKPVAAKEMQAAASRVITAMEDLTPKIVIVTGMSGAGRSKAAAALEDLDWYVVDNLPPRLLTSLAGMVRPDGGVQRLAVVVDVRSRHYFQDFMQVLEQINGQNIDCQIIFLDAADQELVKRYESSRRPHPLQGDGRLTDGIAQERRLLEGIRHKADVVVDTTNYSVHDLARRMREIVAPQSRLGTKITVMSFGFKHGLPMDANLVIDMRFVPNPYWVTEIRHLTGLDIDVSEYVFSQVGVEEFVENYLQTILPMFDGFEREIKNYVTIAVGCTGGKHRSVAIAERLSNRLRDYDYPVRTIHRDIGKDL